MRRQTGQLPIANSQQHFGQQPIANSQQHFGQQPTAKESGIFTISLDFELHWGGFEKWSLDEAKRKYFDNTRKVIPELLRLFSENDIHATWATVGMLMHRDKASLLANFPVKQPNYQQVELSAYHFIQHVGIGDDELSDPYHFAHSLVAEVVRSLGQELGTHTFAHYYCNELGQTSDCFFDDLKAAKQAAKPYVGSIVSLVFPRNQFNAEYLRVCHTAGIKIVRSNPLDWWWQIGSTQKESAWKRLNRGMDAYFSIGGKTSYPLQAIEKVEGVYLMPASRLLRPYNPKELYLNKLKIARIKSEMTLAAQKAEVYHLWWHPHNFGGHPEQNMAGLQQVVDHFLYLNQEFGMVSMNMGEVAGLLEKG